MVKSKRQRNLSSTNLDSSSNSQNSQQIQISIEQITQIVQKVLDILTQTIQQIVETSISKILQKIPTMTQQQQKPSSPWGCPSTTDPSYFTKISNYNILNQQ